MTPPMHRREQCEGEPCTFHNPSNHHMKDWPITVRYDRYGLAERLCPHGVGHPDIDSVNWLKGLYDSGVLFRIGVLDPPDPERAKEPNFDAYNIFTTHGCCGCCIPPMSAVDDCVPECTHDTSEEMEKGHWEND
jgi:hypothetical protein